MSVNIKLCPIFSWEDRRDPSGTGGVTDRCNGDIYFIRNKSDSTLRQEFALAFVPTLVGGFTLRLPYRIFSILTGTWAISGAEKCRKVWDAKLQGALSQEESTGSLTKKHYYYLLTTSVLSELAKDIVKCVTLPFGILGMTFSALYGLINPLNARKLYGKIEHAYATPKTIFSSRTEVLISSYFLKCMQPQQVWDTENFYQYAPSYSPYTIRSMLLNLEQFFIQNPFYACEEFDVDKLKNCVTCWERDWSLKGFKDSEELQRREKNKGCCENQVAELIEQFKAAIEKIVALKRRIAEERFIQKASFEEAESDLKKEIGALEVLCSTIETRISATLKE